MTSDLKIIHQEKNGWHTLRINGQIDRTTCGEFEQTVTQIAENPQAKITLDLKELRYINSTGWGLLMATHRQLKQHGGALRIINWNRYGALR